jgi:hypothetical protein
MNYSSGHGLKYIFFVFVFLTPVSSRWLKLVLYKGEALQYLCTEADNECQKYNNGVITSVHVITYHSVYLFGVFSIYICDFEGLLALLI